MSTSITINDTSYSGIIPPKMSGIKTTAFLFIVFGLTIDVMCNGKKRLVLDDAGQQLESILAEIELLQEKVEALEYGVGRDTYTRWGRTVCPADNELVYKGYAAGSHYTHGGGAANWLCLTNEPQWGYYEDSVGSGAKVLLLDGQYWIRDPEGKSKDHRVYGGEYEFSDFHSDGGSKFFGQNLNDEDAPCAVCRAPRSSVLMIPGRQECYTGWTKEYSGYLVAGDYQHSSATEFICLDANAEMIPGGAENHDGKVIYLAEAYCGSLTCPPYVQGRELTCVVCSK